MIIGDKKNDIEMVGQDTSKKATISQDKMAKLQYLLTKGLYKDPQTAVIAEWTNNGVDAVVQAGKDPIKNPVIVSIEKSKKDANQWIFAVEDKGTGLDDRDFEDICMNYLESTKDQSNEFIGSFGIGMKSFLGLERHAVFTCRKNGRERVYMVYEGEEFVNYQIVSDKDTKEENGVRAELILNGYNERSNFISKVKAKLAYYDTVVIIIDGKPVDNTIFRSKLFQWANLNTDKQTHLCLKDVYYPIDWQSLDIPQINFPVALRFNLGEGITPTPSRESYITTEAVKTLLKNRIKEVAEWFVSKYKSTTKFEYDTFLEAYPEIDRNIYITEIEGVQFHINPLLKYSDEIIPDISIKGVTLRSPSFYKAKDNELVYEWQEAGFYAHSGKWTMKTRRSGVSIRRYIYDMKKNPVLVPQTPVGNMREFLKHKYGYGTLFVTKVNTRNYWCPDEKIREDHSYHGVLGLRKVSRGERREFIQEWQMVRDSVAATFIDETKVLDSKEFAIWLQKKKDDMRARRLAGDYVGLNKQKGDVTIAYVKFGRYGTVSFKKDVYEIQKLPFNRFLTVTTTTDDEKEKIKKIAEMMTRGTVKFALIGKKEIKKIPQSRQFITFKQFMMDSKPFKRLVSAILFSKTIEDFERIGDYPEAIFQNCISSVAADLTTLKKYVEKNLRDTGDGEVKDYILQVAEDNNLYDKELWDVYLRVKEAIKKYDFITCFAEPDSWDEEDRKKYKRVISQMLLFRKRYYNDLPENAVISITVPPPVQETVSEEEEDEDEGEFEEEIELEEA